MKSQTIRLLDIFVIGPLMIYGAIKGRGIHPAARAALGLFGATTIGYNAKNYTIVAIRTRWPG